jgi:folate-binding protein YgfZ
MNPEWRHFLLKQNASLGGDRVLHFGNPAHELEATASSTILCDLSHFGILRVSGDDSESFLQSLLSNDIRDVTSVRGQLSSLSSAKGRVLATMLVWREGATFMLQMPKALCEAVRNKLAIYKLRAKVNIGEVSDDTVSIGLSGNRAPEILRMLLGNPPVAPLETTSITEGEVIKIGETRWQLTTRMDYATMLWNELASHARAVGSICWDWLNIRSGIPVILPQTQDRFVAQMINLELVGGVNFKKGCYPGQEIVARTQYLGKLKRRMYLAHLEIQSAVHGDIPQPGDELFSVDMQGQASGMIVNAAPAPGGGYDVLASMQISSMETAAVHWKSLGGPTIHILPLPYAVPNA